MLMTARAWKRGKKLREGGVKTGLVTVDDSEELWECQKHGREERN